MSPLTGFEKLLIARPSMSDAAVVTASDSASSSTAVTNVQIDRPKQVWVTEALPGPTIDIHFLDATPSWNLMWLGFTNMGDADTCQVRTAASQAELTSGPAYTSSALIPVPGPVVQGHRDDRAWVHWLLWLGDSSARTEAWARLTFAVTNPRIPSGYAGPDFLSVGRLFADLVWRPPYNYTLGLERDPAAEKVTEIETFGGEVVRRRRGKKRTVSFRSEWMSYEEAMDHAEELGRMAGRDGDLVVILDPASTRLDRDIYWGFLTELSLSQQAPAEDPLYSVNFALVQEVAD